MVNLNVNVFKPAAVINDIRDLLDRKFDPIDYEKVGKAVLLLKEHSMDYLRSSLAGIKES